MEQNRCEETAAHAAPPESAAPSSDTTKATVSTLLANAIWGFSYILNRIVQRYAAPVHILSLRFILATALMTLLLLTARRSKGDLLLRGKKIGRLALFSVVSASVYFVEAYAIYLTDATFSGVISALTPIAAMVLAIFLLREYPTKQQAVYSFVPVAGVILMSVAGSSLGIFRWYGVLVALLNCLICAVFRVVNRWCAQEFNFFQRTWATMFTSMCLYTAITLILLKGDIRHYLEPLHHSGFVGALLLLAVFCSVTATLLANYGAGRLPVVRYSALGTTVTVVAAFAGVLILREPISVPMWIGIALIILGVWKVNTTGRTA